LKKREPEKAKIGQGSHPRPLIFFMKFRGPKALDNRPRKAMSHLGFSKNCTNSTTPDSFGELRSAWRCATEAGYALPCPGQAETRLPDLNLYLPAGLRLFHREM
jgi:hypothetical protein